MRSRRERWGKLLAVVLMGAVIGACGGESGPPADPPGTIPMNIEDGGRIYFSTLEQCGSNAPSTTCSMGCIWSYAAIFWYKSNLNFTGVSVSDCPTKYTAVEIADVGPVAGLAEVTGAGASGFTSTLAAQVGHGYLIRFSLVGGATTTVRLYVVDWLTSATTGGVIGVRTKYAHL